MSPLHQPRQPLRLPFFAIFGEEEVDLSECACSIARRSWSTFDTWHVVQGQRALCAGYTSALGRERRFSKWIRRWDDPSPPAERFLCEVCIAAHRMKEVSDDRPPYTVRGVWYSQVGHRPVPWRHAPPTPLRPNARAAG